MRKYNVIFNVLILILSTVSLSAQNLADLPNMREIKGKKLLEKIVPKQNPKDGLWGYVNQEDKFSVKPIFTDACQYEGKVARISLAHKWGAINEKGLFQILPIYEALEPFSEDSLAVFKINGKYGIINAKGGTVLKPVYDSFEYTDYGYVVEKDGLFGTVDKLGKPLLEPQFEKIELLDKQKGISHIRKGGKWGVMSDGRDVLTIKWDAPITFLQSGTGNHPDLYLAKQNGSLGVVSLYGDYVVQPIYDNIELSTSGDYYITSDKRKYGALSLNMAEIFPAIMDTKPFLGENIFKVHDDGRFYCANVKGAIDFDKCADLYQLFKPEEYITTKYFPQWAKTHVIEENLLSRQDRLDKAATVCDKMMRYDYDVKAASMDKEIPSGFRLHFPESWNEKYGIMKKGVFSKTSQSGILYRAYEDTENNVTLEYNPYRSEYVIKVDDCSFSMQDVVRKFNIKEFVGFYPKEYARVNESEIMVNFAFVRSANDVATPLMETEAYMLPLSAYPVKVYNGPQNPSLETSAVITFSLDSLKATSCLELVSGIKLDLVFSRFGGFYTRSDARILADKDSPLKKYDRHGRLDWEYRPPYNEVYYDIEETENYIYICGSVNDGNKEMPIVRQLSKRGKSERVLHGTSDNARYTGILCDNYILYVSTTFLKNTPSYGRDYYPVYCLDQMNDNVGVWYKCIWEDWGTGKVGGMGLTDMNGTWLQTPNLSEQVSSAFDWEFGRFSGDDNYLVVRHMGNFGLVGRDGSMLIDPKYELLEALDNPQYFRGRFNGYYGVVDINDRVIVPFEYSYVGSMSEDIIVVSKDGLYGCYDKNGKMTVPMEYEEIREYVDGMARIRFKKRFGFIDKKGETVVAPFSDEVENFSEGFTLVTIKGKKGFVSFSGDWIAAPMYDDGKNFSAGLAPLSQSGKYGYIDKSGNFVIPMQFNNALEFDVASGLACVATAGKWGIINTSGMTVIPMEFDKVEICTDGYVYVEKNGKCGIYSHRGKVIFEPVCDSIERLKGGKLFRHGVANARLNGNRIKIDEYGNIIHQYTMLTDVQPK